MLGQITTVNHRYVCKCLITLYVALVYSLWEYWYFYFRQTCTVTTYCIANLTLRSLLEIGLNLKIITFYIVLTLTSCLWMSSRETNENKSISLPIHGVTYLLYYILMSLEHFFCNIGTFVIYSQEKLRYNS